MSSLSTKLVKSRKIAKGKVHAGGAAGAKKTKENKIALYREEETINRVRDEFHRLFFLFDRTSSSTKASTKNLRQKKSRKKNNSKRTIEKHLFEGNTTYILFFFF